MNYLRYMLLWLRRMGYSRGFGIQSPTVYAFVRYVVNEHWPYYAYDDLKDKLRGADRTTRSLCRLLFRISNSTQPACSLLIAPSHPAMKDYVKAGCRRTALLEWPLPVLKGGLDEELQRTGVRAKGPFNLVVCPADLCDDAVREMLFRHLEPDSVLVITDIHANRRNKACWRRLLADGRTVVTLDLYSCGIVFFDPTKTKYNYLINF